MPAGESGKGIVSKVEEKQGECVIRPGAESISTGTEKCTLELLMVLG